MDNEQNSKSRTFKMLLFWILSLMVILLVVVFGVLNHYMKKIALLNERYAPVPLTGSVTFIVSGESKITSLEKVILSPMADDPLVIGLQLHAEIITGAMPATIKRYYFNIDDPQRLLEVKFSPIDVPYTVFALPRLPGEYRFAAEIYDNRNSMLNTTNSLVVTTEGDKPLGPTIIFPPSSVNLDIPMVTLKIVNKSGGTITFETVSKIVSKKKDFVENRKIMYDFNGDGMRDITTGNNIVQHDYTGEKSDITARVKVVYNGYVGIATSERIYIGGNDTENIISKTIVSTIPEIYKQSILIAIPPSSKAEVDNLFSEIENSAGDENIIKMKLFKILDIGQEHFIKGNLKEMDMDFIQKDICNIVNYFKISGTTCKNSSDINADKQSSGGNNKTLKGVTDVVGLISILGIIGTSAILIIGIIVVIKQRKILDLQKK